MAALLVISSTQGQVTKRDDATAKLLNEWYNDGTAAGLAAITYENRDGQHSALNTKLYPQLQVFEHTSLSGADKGPAGRLRLGPTVGNCSMAAPAVSGGSLPRFFMMDPGRGAQFLMMQYLANNLFVYPEHQDYDIGANGVGGYGDLYPMNTPAVLISQGSSGSDQVFLQAVLSTLAAFPRETQRVLIEKRLLIPTVQAILRQCYRTVKKPDDYFTGAAHPVVFDGTLLDEEKMARMAQGMTPDKIPPLVQVAVVEESEPQAGKQFFEGPKPLDHKLADARVCISRVFRGSLDEHGMVIDLSKVADLMGRPMQLSMRVLQGDPRLVRIDHAGAGPYARLRVRWQPPFINRTGIRSSRVDIGIFASNGTSVSAPAIISFFMLPNERRFYQKDGRLAEIEYQAPNPDVGLPASDNDTRWLRVMLASSLAGDGLRSRLMEKLLNEEQRKAIQAVWLPLDKRFQTITAMEAKPGGKEGTANLRTGLEKDIATALEASFPGAEKVSLKLALTAVFYRLADINDLYLVLRKDIDAMAAQSSKKMAANDIRREVQRLLDLGVLIEQADGTLTTAAAQQQWTAADHHYLRGLNLTVLSQAVFPEVLERAVGPAFVDLRLTTPKPWRDVFRYDEISGKLLGWVRHQAGRTHFFDAEGLLLPEGPKHPEKAQAVTYDRNAQGVMEWR
ncbi:hypothetical protein [Brevifollis gellanilyticus]|uniref:Uncharacterized protein n=1 Tax=Brevifollis gellanilyticus TaxID=748831 RepID=A0A512ME31_9BACT|nr:hypothetical protein [Brevifollis gellanilyticus]GEP44994.1 hypothetical protein BGE01nite_42850 [Brevifollis gellanilyticus]